MIKFELDAGIDTEALAATYAREGHVRIARWLSVGSTNALASTLLRERRWRHVIYAPSREYEIARADLDTLDPAQRTRIDEAVAEAARDGFQFRYDTIRASDLPDARNFETSAIDGFADFMNGQAAISVLRTIVGGHDLFADAQATAFRPGDFLTAHDDNVPGKRRRAAYVLGLTEGWRTEWGGLLTLHSGADSGRYYAPAFGTLDVFAVPQLHSVSLVAPWAGCVRLSVTGWLRDR